MSNKNKTPANPNYYEPTRKRSLTRPLRTGGLGYGFYSPSSIIILTYLPNPNPNTIHNTFSWDGVTFTLSSVVPNTSRTYLASKNFNPSTTVPYSASLLQATIPNSVTSICDYAFLQCTSLSSIIIPNSVKSIGNGAFKGCALTSIIIPDSVTSIGAEAFTSCSLLTSVTIGNSVMSIGTLAFAACTGLTSITIPNSVTSLGIQAFQFCTFTSITIPASVTSICTNAFQSSGLTTVTIANGQVISGNTFYSPANNVAFFGVTVATISP